MAPPPEPGPPTPPAADPPGPPFTILAFGAFAPGQVSATYEPGPRPTTPELEAAIAATWAQQTAAAARDGRMLFNGELIRYLGHETAPGPPPTLRLRLGLTCYRDFVGTNLYGRDRLARAGWERFANPVGTTATLVTADGLVCYGRRSARVAFHGGHVHTFGGALEGQDLAPDGTIDPWAALRRELAEELGLGPGDLLAPVCTGLIRDHQIFQPELLFEAGLTLTAAELARRWAEAESRDEHDALVTLPDRPEAVLPFLRGCGPIAPVAVGALLLHGRRRWGEAWFEETARRSAETACWPAETARRSAETACWPAETAR